MTTTFSVFGLDGQMYGLFAAMAAVVLMAGMRLFAKELPKGTCRLLGVLGMALGIVLARALYCAVHVSDFVNNYENPWLMLRFFDGGLAMGGLLAGLLLAAVLAAKGMKICPAKLLDAMCVPLGLAIALLRLGEGFTDLGVGAVVEEGFATQNFSWLFLESRMGVMVEYRLNVWLYEAVAGAALFALVLWFDRKAKRRCGDTALFFFSLYGASQILLESMRDDGHMLIIFLRVGQLAAALCVLISCGILCKKISRRQAVVGWLVMLAAVAGIVVLEFSLDGRLTFGTPTLLRDYSLMALCCAAMAGVNVSFLKKRA